METINSFAQLAATAAGCGCLSKLVFSRPADRRAGLLRADGHIAVSGDRQVFVFISTAADGKQHQKNMDISDTEKLITAITDAAGLFRQGNLLTTAGDAEYRSNGKTSVILGGDKLSRRMAEGAPAAGIQDMQHKKEYLLSGSEPFLFELGIADEKGRVHDKAQAKFRQINKFLEFAADVYPVLPGDGRIVIYDLCCGKSYLSFAVYHYFANILGRDVALYGADLKTDVMRECSDAAKRVGFSGMSFEACDVRTFNPGVKPDMVLSLHACDTATDIVLERAVSSGAQVILSTPCCHRELSRRIDCAPLSFVTDYPALRHKLCDALTDGMRLAYLRASGYRVSAAEFVDPVETPKNIMLRAVKRTDFDPQSAEASGLSDEYERIRGYLLYNGDRKEK